MDPAQYCQSTQTEAERLAELSDWDENLLKLELAELSALDLGFNIELTGFDTVDLDRLLDPPSPVNPDLADNLPALNGADAVSRRGDLWLLGPVLSENLVR